MRLVSLERLWVPFGFFLTSPLAPLGLLLGLLGLLKHFAASLGVHRDSSWVLFGLLGSSWISFWPRLAPWTLFSGFGALGSFWDSSGNSWALKILT